MCTAILALSAGQPPESPHNSRIADSRIPVRYTDVRKDAGITFLQDSTQTDEKYYLETMGTGVAWIDYDQDGLMDLYLRAICRHRYLQAATPLALRALSQQRRRHFYRRH